MKHQGIAKSVSEAREVAMLIVDKLKELNSGGNTINVWHMTNNK